jgi:hypothetical protein
VRNNEGAYTSGEVPRHVSHHETVFVDTGTQAVGSDTSGTGATHTCGEAPTCSDSPVSALYCPCTCTHTHHIWAATRVGQEQRTHVVKPPHAVTPPSRAYRPRRGTSVDPCRRARSPPPPPPSCRGGSPPTAGFASWCSRPLLLLPSRRPPRGAGSRARRNEQVPIAAIAEG